jgi:hypothetical protein
MKTIFPLFLLITQLSYASCNLSDKTLSNCDFSNKNLENVDFSKKTLNNINFTKSNLFGTIFNKTKMENVNFNKANLFGAFFVEAVLDNVTFNQSDVSSADFTGVKFLSDIKFDTATKDETTFGELTVEKPEILKVKSCEVILNNDKKSDWYAAMLSLTLDAGNAKEFLLEGLCRLHKNATFYFNEVISINKKKKKFVFTYNSCRFPIYVSLSKKNIHLTDMYNPTCLKNSNTSSRTNIYCSNLSSQRDRNLCMGVSIDSSYCNSLYGRDKNMCIGIGRDPTFCNYLSSSHDINLCKGMSGEDKYCNYLDNSRDFNMCKGGTYCNYLSNTRDINMCKGMSR